MPAAYTKGNGFAIFVFCQRGIKVFLVFLYGLEPWWQIARREIEPQRRRGAKERQKSVLNHSTRRTGKDRREAKDFWPKENEPQRDKGAKGFGFAKVLLESVNSTIFNNKLLQSSSTLIPLSPLAPP